jgi:hypothetical protein
MRRSILAVCMVIVVISAVILPVAAAPKPDPLTDIWNWVKAMQQWTKSVSDQLGTIVTKLTTLQSDVTSIKTTVNDIDTKIQQPQQQEMCNWYTGTFSSQDGKPIKLSIANYGYTETEIEYWVWFGNDNLYEEAHNKVTIPRGAITYLTIDNTGGILGSVVRLRAPPQVTPKWDLEFTDHSTGESNHAPFSTVVCE